MVSDRMNRFRYRLNTRRYEIRRDNALRLARLRYRLDNMAMGGALKIGLLVLLGATPFVLYFLLQPNTPTAVEDPVSNISRNTNPPAPLVLPITPSPTPSLEPSPTPSTSPTPSPSPSPAAQCSNGKDDDKDGRTDFPADKGCSSRTDRSESPDPSPTPSPPAPAPAPPPPPPVNPPAPPPPAPLPACGDGLDNDDDGLPDFGLDQGCSSPDDNDESGPAPSPTPPSPSPTPTPSQTTSAQRSSPQLPPEIGSLLPGTIAPLI
jgi:hypothetical protein